jgi:3-oxoacyl-[acyl-carrier protein] reductase
MDFGLQQKVVLLTGVTGGIGENICQGFYEAGAWVVPLVRGDTGRLQALLDWAAERPETGGRIVPQSGDITDKSMIGEMVASVLAQFGRIDVLVNCAGIAHEGPFLLMEDEQWEEVMQVNFTSAVWLTKAVLKPMFKARGGAIVNVSSVLGSRFGRGVVAYSAAKAGIERFTETVAQEVGRKGIRVNAVCPGVIQTKMSQRMQFFIGDKVMERTPLQRVGQPEEVTKAVLFLASEKMASFITGHKLYVDGGISL